jgi:hypothetical protein
VPRAASSLAALLCALAFARPAPATCPADCAAGGGPAATDCFVEFDGIVTTNTACTDGNPSCDMDGVVNGVCVFPISTCINVSGDPACTSPGLSAAPVVRPAKSAVAQALGQALAALDPTQALCTPRGIAVPLATSLQGVKPGTARLVITASAGSKKDRDKLRLTCRPSPGVPSLRNVVEPIFAAHCALPACHAAVGGSIAPVLNGPDTHAALVDVAAANVPSMSLVRPGSVAQSYLARKILGKRIPDHTARMPNGCPANPPAAGCLTDGEIAAILAWIQTGAEDN